MRQLIQPRWILLAICTSLIGCSMKRPLDPTFNQKMLKTQDAKIKAGEDPFAEPKAEPSADIVQSSLWAKSIGSPYIIRNQKAQKVGDLLTVQVVESAQATTGAKTGAKRDNTISTTGTLGAGQGVLGTLGQLNIAAENKNEFKGEGQTDHSGSLQTTVQAVVESVLPNGTLFVKGHKVITINKEDQEIILSGFVRPDDIRINNTVVSSMLADAEIRYVGEGVVSDKQNTGWGTRLMDALWPF